MSMTSPRGSRRERLFLVDGNSFCYRAFYAIPGLTNSRGEPTNAIYGFVTMMRKLLEDQRPELLAVCFDPKGKTFRHEQYKDYKAHRKPMPPELVSQIEPIREFCRLSRFSMFEKQGFEADDVIGTLAARAQERGNDVWIVTGDKDAFQLVNDRVKIFQPHKNNLVYDVEGVQKKFAGLGPDKIVEILALMGDASDNIPGVPGIGEKTAIKLMQRFGSVENILKNSREISSEKIRNALKENEVDLRLSLSLAKIDTQVDLEIDWNDVKVQPADEDALVEFFKRYEFRGFAKQSASQNAKEKEKRDYHTVLDASGLKKLAAALKKSNAFSFDTETTSADPMKATLVGMSFSMEPYIAHYVPTTSDSYRGPGICLKEALDILGPVLENETIEKFGQNIKYDTMVLRRHGVELKGISFDTMIASYLIDPVKRNHNLDDISLNYLNVKKIETESLVGKGKDQISMADVSLEKISEYACEDADCVMRLVPILREKIKELGLEDLYKKVELPLADVLGKMEMNGVALDTDVLAELSQSTRREIDGIIQKIYREAGEEFNLDSPKQLAEILFVKKKLPTMKKTKTGYSTDASVLEKLAVSYEFPKLILEYRERAKLRSTYLDALPGMVNGETGCVHTSYHQTTTDTGRLSSSEPNLQNIPVKTEAGRLVRKAFVPRPRSKGKGKILSADYSQIELRILAHFCHDPQLVKAFEEDRDIHAYTATLLYGVKEKEVTREMRNVAKTINFSVLYGKTSYGLAQDLQISIQEADEFIRSYFARYARVNDFLESQKEKAKKNGYLTTILGRRSYFPNLQSSNVALRNYAERAAINAPLQGSAADLIKLAMLRIQKRLEDEKSESLMTMQVHDELVFDAPETEAKALGKRVKEEMENAFELKVPLKVDVTIGDSWYKN